MYSCRSGAAVDGGWSGWSGWSKCSADCGPGTKYRYRLCNNPQPKNGGKECKGEKRQDTKGNEETCGNCANIGKNTKTRSNAQRFTSVKSWSECSNRCATDTSCTYWTWHHENAGKYAFVCVTMTGYGFLVSDPNAVSGTKDCAGCPDKGMNLQGRVNNQVTPGVRSWVECSRKCSKKSSCVAWVWANEGAGDFAYNCALMDGYENKAKDPNVISGSRDCKGEAAEECTGETGTADCCTVDSPCDLGGGDCDSNAECSGDLVCGQNNCKQFNTNAASQNDCCTDSKVDGGWGAWSSWSTCTKTRTRECNKPTPGNG